jgi:hypothetical protein
MSKRPDPLDAPPHKTDWINILRFRRAQVQKLAKARRDDPTFPWFKFGRTGGNILMFLPSGYWADENGNGVPWGSPNAAALLCHGKNAPFDALEDVPPQILDDVASGVAAAVAVGVHVREDGHAIGHRLGLTDAMRRKLRVWQLWPLEMSRAEYEAMCVARHARKADERRAARHRQGMVPMGAINDRAALLREAIAASGKSRATFMRRPKEWRDAMVEAARQARADGAYGQGETVVTPAYKNNTYGVTTVSKRKNPSNSAVGVTVVSNSDPDPAPAAGQADPQPSSLPLTRLLDASAHAMPGRARRADPPALHVPPTRPAGGCGPAPIGCDGARTVGAPLPPLAAIRAPRNRKDWQ